MAAPVVLCDPHSQSKAFSLTHVSYAEGDPLGAVLALCSLTPVFVVVALATLVASRRDFRTCSLVVGVLVDEAVNAVLKKAIAQPRPPTAPDASAHGFGMPSNHAQFVAFGAAYVLLFVTRRCKGAPTWERLLAAVVAVALAGACAASRVYLGYHTTEQVLVGLVVGAGCGGAWFAFTEAVLVRRFADWADTALARALRMRDCSWLPDVIEAEWRAARRPTQ